MLAESKKKISSLIEAGCNFMQPNKVGKTAIDLALEQNKPELAEFLEKFQKSA
jgi:hypothetical protein